MTPIQKPLGQHEIRADPAVYWIIVISQWFIGGCFFSLSYQYETKKSEELDLLFSFLNSK